MKQEKKYKIIYTILLTILIILLFLNSISVTKYQLNKIVTIVLFSNTIVLSILIIILGLLITKD
jgi:hypothetical protein